MPRHRYNSLFPHQPGWAPTWRGRVPRLIPTERTLLFAWLDRHGVAIDELWYDVRMDGIPDDEPEASPDELVDQPALMRNWWLQTARRCDAIARTGAFYTILEMRARADAPTVGELEIYDRLSRTEWPELRFTLPTLICHTINATTRRALELRGMTIHTLPDVHVHPTTPLAHLTR
jgi:hypothetical protein